MVEGNQGEARAYTSLLQAWNGGQWNYGARTATKLSRSRESVHADEAKREFRVLDASR